MARVPIGCNARTIDCLSEDASQGCFTNPMKSKEDIAMMKCLCFARISEDFFDKILTDDVGEIFRAIGLVERHVAPDKI
jgi:hypothetical protein